jgi:3',5'-cyclic AMP phosphodiesterase CpdA
MSRIVHIADLHFGDEDPNLVDDFLGQLPELAADVVVVAGDLTQTGSRAEFAQAAEFLGAIPAPIVLTPGNHDTPLLNVATRMTRPWRRLQKAMGEVADDRFRDARLHIESFNSARGVQFRLDWSLGVVSKKKLADPLAALAASDVSTKILTAHHPILSPLENRGRAKTKRAPKFAQEIGQVADLVLTGHLHQCFSCPVTTDDRTAWFVGASTAFSSRTREEPAGFNLIEVSREHFDMTPYRAKDGRFDRAEMERLDRAG